ncbi:MAG: transcriptional regulator with XRE-family HTH domain [Acidimicrobiales bacterium]|jgi:transcriptional regulator with XRE-family HTH domain
MTNPTPDPLQSRGELVPVKTYATPDSSKRGGVPIGTHLEKARKRLGYTPASVARVLWLTERTIDDYESGMRTPPSDVLARLAELYGLDVERLMGGRPSGSHDDHSLSLGWADIDIPEGASNAHVLQTIAQTLRLLRSIAESSPVSIRDDELTVVASHLDTAAPDLHLDLGFWFALDHRQAEELAARMRYQVTQVKELPPSEDHGPRA